MNTRVHCTTENRLAPMGLRVLMREDNKNKIKTLCRTTDKIPVQTLELLRDGKIILHQKQGSFSMEYSTHNQEVKCIDSKGGVIVSSSKDKIARLWSLSSTRQGECLHTIPTLDFGHWPLVPRKGREVVFCVCSSFCQLLTCLGTDFRRGAGVLDVVYESPSTLLSCGYNTFIRCWDVRASTR
ncbi:F-box/WD repeat-containing protein 4 [Acipenser ruthenus]|uniref:F-box/WD repeat-containing protein 4 n=1 Tax=Acipenser ruthenus TaxID=7906 RepID=A0A444TWT4_ACIRT|nr:F-box/WD repeat-containing protein 4 [Acipenser ruthenus]